MHKKGKLELTWVGKYDEEMPVEPRILREDPEKSYGDSDSENMLIHGDNLIAEEVAVAQGTIRNAPSRKLRFARYPQRTGMGTRANNDSFPYDGLFPYAE